MTCTTCEEILNGNLRCTILTYRKYLIGALIGGALVYFALKMRRKK
jgi:hypothetical protein